MNGGGAKRQLLFNSARVGEFFRGMACSHDGKSQHHQDGGSGSPGKGHLPIATATTAALDHRVGIILVSVCRGGGALIAEIFGLR